MVQIEREELFDRMKAMTAEEQQLAVMAFPSHILIDEISRRDKVSRKMLSDIRGILEGGAL